MASQGLPQGPPTSLSTSSNIERHNFAALPPRTSTQETFNASNNDRHSFPKPSSGTFESLMRTNCNFNNKYLKRFTFRFDNPSLQQLRETSKENLP